MLFRLRRGASVIAVLMLLALALGFGWKVIAGRVLVPGDTLLLMAPWKYYTAMFPGITAIQNVLLDPVQQYYPWRVYATESLRAGTVPLWNPYAFCGTPFLANLQSAIFYPLNAIFLLMPIARAFSWGALLHLFLAGWFMFAFLRTAGIRRSAAVIGAVAYMFNGFTIAWLEFPTFSIWVNIWLPLVLYLYELAVRRGRWGYAVLAGLVVGVQFLGGQLQFSGYLLIAFVIYALVRAFALSHSADHPHPQPSPLKGEGEGSRADESFSPGGRRCRMRGIGRFRLQPLAMAGCALVVGGLLAAMQLLPSLELVTRSSRPQQAAAEAVKSALPVSNLVTYLVPNFYGSPANQTYWGNLRGRGTDFFETACYLGVLPLLLALLGAGDWRAADPRRRFMARFLVIAGLFALLLALGSPVYYLFYWLIPPFRQLSGVARAVSLAAFAGAGLAALGTERLLADPPRVSRWFLPGFAIGALALVGAVVAQYAGVVLSNDPKLAEVRGFWWREMALFGALLLVALVLVHLRRRGRIGAHAFATAAFVVVVFDLFRFGINFNPACNPKTVFFETPSLEYLQSRVDDQRLLTMGTSFMDKMPPSTPMVYGLRDIQGSESLWYGRYHRLLKTINPAASTHDWPRVDSPLLDLLGVGYAFSTLDRDPIVDPTWELAYDADGRIYRNLEVMPRAFVASRVRAVPEVDFLSAVAGAGPEIREEAIVADDAAPAHAGPATGAAVVTHDDARGIEVSAMTDRRGLLVLTEVLYPGWRVWVDGRPATPVYTDYVLRGVWIEAGTHTVTWKYEPVSYRAGLFLSLLGLATLAAATMAALTGRRHATT